MDWFLYDNGLRHEGVKSYVNKEEKYKFSGSEIKILCFD